MKRLILAIGPKKEKRDISQRSNVRHVRNQQPTSSDLLRKYEYQYQQRLWQESEEEDYERRTGKRLKKHEDVRDHWHCLFFRYCWDSGMSQLPTTRDCPECGPVKPDAKGVSVFWRLGPVPTQQEQIQSPQKRVDFEEEEDKYHHPRWCPDGLNHSQKCRVQRLRSLEEAEARYLESLRKARPDLVDKIHHVQKRELRPPRKEWRPKSTRADVRIQIWYLCSLQSSTLEPMRSYR
jgi:hypothetical protein